MLHMRKYQTPTPDLRRACVGLRVLLDVLLLRDRALPLATSLSLGVDIESCFLEQAGRGSNACGQCKKRQQQVMRSLRA